MRGRGDWRWIAVAGVTLVSILIGEASWAGYGSQGNAGKPEAAQAQSPPPCNSCPCNPANAGPNPSQDGAGGEPGSAKADPVMLFNGAFVHERTDLVVNGVVPIPVIRRYDSSSTYDSPVGYGWSLNWDLRLYEVGQEIVIRTRCGQQDRYLKPAEPGAAILQPADPSRGSVPKLERLASGLYVVNYPGGSRAFFDDRGRLESLQTPQGNRLRITYKSPTRQAMKGIPAHTVTPGAAQPVAMVFQIDRVSEELFDRDLGTPAFVPTGRYVEFAYDANGRLQSATASDGRSVTYVHPTVTGGTSGNLIQVNGLAGLVDVYGYTDPNDIHDLTSLQEGQGGTGGTPAVATLNIQYANGRVALQTLGQTEWTFQYPTALTRTILRKVVDAGGTHTATSKYTFNTAGFLVEKIDEAGTKFEYTRNTDTFISQIKVSRSTGPSTFELVRTVDQTFAGGRPRTRTVQVAAGVTHTESWEFADEWLKAYEVVHSDEPDRIFRTEFTFYRNGLHVGQELEGYQATDPITNIYEIKRTTAASGGVATAFETTTLEYDEFGRLTRITPPALSVSPDHLAIVRSYYGLGESVVAKRGLLAGIHLETGTGTPTVLPELARGFDYDTRGFVQTVTDARSHETTLGWDDLGRLTSVTNDLPIPETTLFTYGAPNSANPATVQPGRHLVQIERGQTSAGEGQLTRLLWDARGFLTEVQRKNDASAFETFDRYAYDSDGNRIRAIDGRGEVRTWTYDDLGRPVTVSDHGVLWTGTPAAPLHTTTFGYDVFGNRTKITDAKSRVTDFVYDGRNRLVSVTQHGDAPNPPLVTTFEYDAAGNVTKVTDPRSQETIYAYDLLSRLGSVEQESGDSVAYLYDARSRLSKTTNARGQALLYEYFSFGGLKEVVHDLDDDGAETGERRVSYTYDENGNVTTVKDTLVTWVTDGLIETFTYDALNRVDTAIAHYIDGAPILDPQYDRFGQRTALNLTKDSTTLRHQWAYDKQGRLVAACLPQDATAVDPCTASSSTKTLGFTPLANDRLSALTHENGLVTNLVYKPFGPIESITVGSAPPYPQQLVYGYDELQNVTSIAETQNGDAVDPDFGFQYDAVYRLIEADYPTGLDLPPSPGESFGYDAASNREDPADEDEYDYDANNRLIDSPGVSARCYDDDGNQTSTRSSGDCDTGTVAETFTWDAVNRLSRYENAGTSLDVSYFYDPFGRRIQKSGSSGTTSYLWDGDRLLAEYDGSGNRTVRYAYAEGFAPMQVAYVDGSSEDVYHVHSDHLDTPRMLTDEDDISVWRASYEAFGTAHLSSDPDGSIPTQNPNITFNIRFPGQYYDAESGLHYNRFRYYSPDVGRYVSADPVGQFALQARYGASVAVQQSEYGAVSPNLYSYVFNNTLNKIDPSGLSSSDVGAIIAKSNSEVSATTARGERNPLGGRLGGALGNLNSVFFGGPAKGCSELADGLANALNDAFASEDFALDDNWRASVVTDSDYPGPYHNDGDPTEFNVLPHQTVIVESSNPDDPKIRLDPQRGRVRIDW